MPAAVNLALYREEHERLRERLSTIEAQRRQVIRAIRDTEMLIATVTAPGQPLLPIDGLQLKGRRATTRHGRAAGAKLKPRDRKVLRIVNAAPIGFAELQKRTGINEWTLRDSIVRLIVAGKVQRFGLARATKFAKASLKTEPDTALVGFLVSR